MPIFKYMLGAPVSIDDIEFLDTQLYLSLIFIRDQCSTSESLEALSLDFSVTEITEDGVQVVDLKPEGRDIDVILENKDEYLDCMVQYHLVDQVKAQLEHFLTGLFEVCKIV